MLVLKRFNKRFGAVLMHIWQSLMIMPSVFRLYIFIILIRNYLIIVVRHSFPFDVTPA
jgi:hypothetical protein